MRSDEIRKEALSVYSHANVRDRYDADLMMAGFSDGAEWADAHPVAPEPSAPSEHGGTIPLYGMLDVWMALNGTSHPEFDAFYAEHGYAETWARILAAVRQRRSEPQGEPSDAPIRNHGGWDMGLQSKSYPPSAAVDAALTAWNATGGSDRVAMRAALRAAQEAR